MHRYIIALAALAAVSIYAIAQDIKATATPEAKAAFAEKVAAVPMTAAREIPAKWLQKVRITSVIITYGTAPEDTRVFVAWENCGTVDGKLVAINTDNATLTYADLGKVDPLTLTTELVGILKAKGKF